MAGNNQKLGLPRNALIVDKENTMPKIVAQSLKKNLRIRRPSKKSKEFDGITIKL